jgi:penicillin-binding protein 2
VKLVGIVSADTGLHLPDFRAAERTFSLIVQVSGRAGRFAPDGKVIKTFEPVMTADTKLDKRYFTLVKEGMRGVVNEPGGTAYANARLDQVSMSGKTGSAQSGTGGGDHAWFIAYAPSDAPSVAMSILVEHGLHGASAAAPIAKAVAQVMFPLQKPAEGAPPDGREQKEAGLSGREKKQAGEPGERREKKQMKPAEQNAHR